MGQDQASALRVSERKPCLAHAGTAESPSSSCPLRQIVRFSEIRRSFGRAPSLESMVIDPLPDLCLCWTHSLGWSGGHLFFLVCWVGSGLLPAYLSSDSSAMLRWSWQGWTDQGPVTLVSDSGACLNQRFPNLARCRQDHLGDVLKSLISRLPNPQPT